MKKKFFIIIQICIVFCAVTAFFGCNDSIEAESGGGKKGVSVVPNPMTVGQPVSVSGPDFKNATKITFPGGIAVTNFTKAGDFQLNTTVPAGAASEGNITVSLPGNEYVIPITVTIFSTKDAIASSKDKNPTTGNVRVGPNDKLTINGQGLSAIAEIILPGGLSIQSMNFPKKTDLSIEITIPMGGFNRTAVEPLKMKTKSGAEVYTANRIDWGGDGFVPPELIPFCGRSFKVWTWDDKAPNDTPFGNGGYNNDKGPAWWTIKYDAINGQHGGAGHGIGAKMAFYLPNKMVLTLTNGRVYEGLFSIDMTKGVGTWSSGKLEIVAGDDALSIIGATYGNYNGSYSLTPKIFDIINQTGTVMTLAFRYPEETGTANFYLYRVVEGEGEGGGK